MPFRGDFPRLLSERGIKRLYPAIIKGSRGIAVMPLIAPMRAERGIIMSKTAVVYWSATGNTEAMANAVAEGAKEKGAECSLFTAA